jgi:hypothetical protein
MRDRLASIEQLRQGRHRVGACFAPEAAPPAQSRHSAGSIASASVCIPEGYMCYASVGCPKSMGAAVNSVSPLQRRESDGLLLRTFADVCKWGSTTRTGPNRFSSSRSMASLNTTGRGPDCRESWEQATVRSSLK